MPFLKSLADEAVLLDVFQMFPATSRELIEYHEELLHGDSPIPRADLELIAAYVSHLNGCKYCRGAHTAVTEYLGTKEGLVYELLEDIDSADVSDQMKPLLKLARKLTEKPDSLTQADADAVYAAGWDERAYHDAVAVTALFNFMNRFVEGMGLIANPDYFPTAGERIGKSGYGLLLKILGPKEG